MWEGEGGGAYIISPWINYPWKCKSCFSLDVPIRGAQFAADRIAPIRSDLKPRGPKDWKNQYFAPGLKFSSDQSRIEIFNRDWNFQANHTTRLGNYQGRDCNFQSRLKISIRDWNFQAWIENFKRMDWKFHAINRDWFFSIASRTY